MERTWELDTEIWAEFNSCLLTASMTFLGSFQSSVQFDEQFRVINATIFGVFYPISFIFLLFVCWNLLFRDKHPWSFFWRHVFWIQLSGPGKHGRWLLLHCILTLCFLALDGVQVYWVIVNHVTQLISISLQSSEPTTLIVPGQKHGEGSKKDSLICKVFMLSWMSKGCLYVKDIGSIIGSYVWVSSFLFYLSFTLLANLTFHYGTLHL